MLFEGLAGRPSGVLDSTPPPATVGLQEVEAQSHPNGEAQEPRPKNYLLIRHETSPPREAQARGPASVGCEDRSGENLYEISEKVKVFCVLIYLTSPFQGEGPFYLEPHP